MKLLLTRFSLVTTAVSLDILIRIVLLVFVLALAGTLFVSCAPEPVYHTFKELTMSRPFSQLSTAVKLDKVAYDVYLKFDKGKASEEELQASITDLENEVARIQKEFPTLGLHAINAPLRYFEIRMFSGKPLAILK